MSNIITVAFSTFRENYLKYVVELLKTLEKQTIDKFEVIVVVNSNKHYFKELLNAVKNGNEISYEIQILFNPIEKGIAHSRNIALKKAKTPYIAYTDDDVIPNNLWLEELLWPFRLNEKVAAVTGPVLCKWEHGIENYASWFPNELNWIIGCHSRDVKNVTITRNGFGSNLALRKGIPPIREGFNEKFGFNQVNPMAGEESELGIRLMKWGYVTLWNPSAIVYHRIFRDRLKIRNILVRSFIEGKTKAYLKKVHGSDAIRIEANHLQSVIKSFIKTKSFKSKVLLLLTTITVLSGYLLTHTRSVEKRGF